MNILKRLTIKDLKLNKKRTIGTLIGIILAIALITVVGGMFFSMRKTLIESEIQSNGYYHVQLSDISESEVNNVKNNKDFSHIETMYDLGNAVITLENDRFQQLHTYSMSKETADYLKYNITEGRFPENGKEIAISSYYLKSLNLKLGDKINFVSGDLIDNENEVAFEYEPENTRIINGKEYEFTIVGALNQFSRNAVTTDVKTEKIDAYLTLKNPGNYKEDINELLGTTDYKKETSPKYKFLSINKSLLEWEVFAFSDSIMKVLIGMVVIVIFIILITSVFSIRNSFAISTTEKTKMYGMLASVGTTKKQLRKMVMHEGTCMGIIGIPTGAILGTFVTWLLVQVINAVAKNGGIIEEGFKIYYEFSLIPVVLAAIVGIVMIYWSIIKCAKRASKVSPLQNIRNSDNLSSKKTKLKVPGIIRGIFKIGGVLAYKNLKRNKKKYRVTVVSLTVSICIFITVSSLVSYGMKILKERYIDLDYNVVVSSSTNKEEIFNDENKVNELKNLDNSYMQYSLKEKEYNNMYTITDTSHVIYQNIIEDYSEISDNKSVTKGISVQLLIFDNEYFKHYAKKINKDYDKIKDKVIVVNKTLDKNVSNKKKYVEIVNYKEGDKILLTNIGSNKELNYEIGGITDIAPLGNEQGYADYLSLVVNKDYFKDDIQLSSIYYNSANSENLTATIEKKYPSLYVFNIEQQANAMKSLLLIFSIFVYGFITVITFIGVTAIFNTITSNMELRKKEFAMLKSIGMTKKEFNNMINLESLFYSMKSLFVGIILGLGGSYLVYTVFSKRWDFGYSIPTIPIIISTVFVLVMVCVIMKYSINKIQKQNIIETIRKENI